MRTGKLQLPTAPSFTMPTAVLLRRPALQSSQYWALLPRSPAWRFAQTSPLSTPSSPTIPAPQKPRRNLESKVAIVTGAGGPPSPSHISNGRATALLLAEDGASVVCVDRSLRLAQHTVDMIDASTVGPAGRRGRPLAVQGDVTSSSSCASVVAATLAEYGRLDMLINVVGILGAGGSAVDVDVQAWEDSMRVNVTSMMLMAKYAVPAMLAKARSEAEPIRGSIVNVGSVAGLRGGTRGNLVYPTSKGAVVNMTRAMAAEHGPDGIRVNCVCPGEFDGSRRPCTCGVV